MNLCGAAYEDRYLKTERGWKITHTVLPHVRGDASGHLDRRLHLKMGEFRLTQRISQSADMPAKS